MCSNEGAAERKFGGLSTAGQAAAGLMEAGLAPGEATIAGQAAAAAAGLTGDVASQVTHSQADAAAMASPAAPS
jgi:hypothetical protein